MTDSPLSRRQFFGATAATAAIGALPVSAADARPSPLAPEPPPPAGVCQRLGSARFRELTSGYHFSPDSKWLVQFGGQYLGYELASGRRVKWILPGFRVVTRCHLTNTALLAEFDDDENPHVFDRESGRERKLPKLLKAYAHLLTPDDSGLIQYTGAEVLRIDLCTGNRVWGRKWQTDATTTAVLLTITDRWVVTLGAQRFHLFDQHTGKDGPRLEDAAPKDAPPDNHFTLVGFSADSKRIAGWHTAEVPNRAVVWDMESGKVVGRVNLPEGATTVAFAADCSHVLTTDQGNRLVGYSVRTGRLTRRLAAENVGEFVLSPDGRTLACGRSITFLGAGLGGFIEQSDSIVRLLNPATGELLPQSPDPSVELKGVRFADPHTVVTEIETGDGNTAHLVWDTRTNHRQRLSSPFPPVQFAGLGGSFPGELSPDGTRYIALVASKRLAGLGGSEVCVTDGTTGRRLYALGGNIHGFPNVPFWIGRGSIGVVSGEALSVFDLAANKWRTVPLKLAGREAVHDHAVTPDGRTVALLHWDATAERPTPSVTWVDVKTGHVATHAGADGNLAVSARGNRMAVIDTGVGQPDEQVRITALDRTGPRSSFVVRSASLAVNSVSASLSPCGRTVYLAHEKPGKSEDAEPTPVVQFWEVLSGEVRAEFVTEYKADGLDVSPCGRRIATTHRDAPIYLWDVFGEKSDPQAKPDATAWDALDAPTDKAFTAIRRLVQHPAAAVELFSAKLKPAEAPKAEWVKARLDKLGSTDFRTRHTADLELSAVADRIVEPLRKAIAAGADSPEADERLNRLFEKAEGIPRSTWRAVRAVEVLEYCEVPEAAVLLKKLAGGVETAVLTREAKAAVKRLK